ncbi:MAG: hypothetical protein LW669_02235 [Sphingobacteriales bacterium]|jgi:hypothetical protein|nr:hypothetical protein [Sphingobacteriales bacterium]
MKTILKKAIGLLLMIAAPIISGRAFYEYASIKFLHKQPSYPFGKSVMEHTQVNDITYLANYESQLLSIGIIFLAVAVLAYISMLVRAFINLVWLALLIGVGFYLSKVL